MSNSLLCRDETESNGHHKKIRRTYIEAGNKKKKIWQCFYAAVSLICVSVFAGILVFLFLIFHNLDNKPWTSIFYNDFLDDIENDKNETDV